MSTTLPPDPRDVCDTPAGQGLLSVEQAQGRILESISPIHGHETVSLSASLGRVLAQDILAPNNVPPFDNSAMDGYALNSADLPEQGNQQLSIIGMALAGAPFFGVVNKGQCVRIMTGAPLPQGCDTIVMQEQAERQGNELIISAGHTIGQHVRRAGEDIAVGQTVLHTGKRIMPADLGLMASLGISHLTVTRRLRVAFFSTGDELATAGTPLKDGLIYDSNAPTLRGLLSIAGIETLDLGIVRDQPESLQTALTQAAAQADVVITSGGVSVGDADMVRDILSKLGDIDFWRVAIKPGRPFAYGLIEQALFFGLPGNPVSTMVTFFQFVLPALRRLMGEKIRPVPRFRVRCITPLNKVPGRMEFQRGILDTDSSGNTVVRNTGAQGSHILHSMSKADCFIILPADCGDVPADTLVEVQPFSGF